MKFLILTAHPSEKSVVIPIDNIALAIRDEDDEYTSIEFRKPVENLYNNLPS